MTSGLAAPRRGRAVAARQGAGDARQRNNPSRDSSVRAADGRGAGSDNNDYQPTGFGINSGSSPLSKRVFPYAMVRRGFPRRGFAIDPGINLAPGLAQGVALS